MHTDDYFWLTMEKEKSKASNDSLDAYFELFESQIPARQPPTNVIRTIEKPSKPKSLATSKQRIFPEYKSDENNH